MKYVLKLIPKRKRKGKKNYDIMIMRKTSPVHGKFLAKLGYYVRDNKNFDILVVDKKKLHFWMLKGLLISRRLEKYLKYC